MGRSINILIATSNWKTLIRKLGKFREHDINELKTVCNDNDGSEDEVRRYPIHYACLNGITKPALKAILDACPDAARQVDDEGSTPLHYLLHYDNGLKCDAIQLLLDVYPEAVGVQDNYGCTPMFHAVEHGIGVNIGVLALLLRSKVAVQALTVHSNRKNDMSSRRKRKDSLAIVRSYFPESSRNDKEYQRTPLYMIWDIAMNTKSSTRWSLHAKQDGDDLKNRRGRKMVGKRLEKAQLMLEAAYLKKPVNPEKFAIKCSGHSGMYKALKSNRWLKTTSTSSFDSRPDSIPLTYSQSMDRIDELVTCEAIDVPRVMSTPSPAEPSRQVSFRMTRSSRDLTQRRRLRLPFRRNKHVVRDQTFKEVELEDHAESRRALGKVGKRHSFVGVVDTGAGSNSFRVLHAVLTLHSFLPEPAYDFALVHYRHQVKEAEEATGNLPLHLACNMTFHTDFYREGILTELITIYEDAARTKKQGRSITITHSIK
eukprot:CAMPEP_0203662462 /NCGR_PEP_ID=MMETSP0090-20130426/417_1 /ASSEMBLY_ACC=CAM_ASM_001088 /TAXON_ID=426623 /ORGANISM="Chaetoceros affinis, Strain CCMP159" /LENGTH=483 /DNA_ID=CAMNT_0050525249 /DNA_START=106 /DNA_END=1557 /DNA_ORIENTATION=-